MYAELLKLALRNILRQRMRSAMTLAAIVIGVAGLILTGGFVQDIYVQLGEAIIHSQTGHVQLAKGEFFGSGSRRPEAFLIEQPAPLDQAVEQHEAVDFAMGRLNFFGLLNNGRSDFAVVAEGIDAHAEARLGSAMDFIAGRALRDEDANGIVVGEGVAQALQLKADDPVTLVVSTPDGAMNTLDFTVIGVFRSFSKDYDARAVRIGLGAAQDLLATPGISVLVVALHRSDDTAQAVNDLNALGRRFGVEARGWPQLNDFYEKTVALYERQFGVLRLIVLIMVLLSVTNTVNMTVFERQGEFGTLRALGNRTPHVFTLIVLESALLGIAGSAAGVVLGVFLAALISGIGIPMPPPPNSNVGYLASIRIEGAVVWSAALIGALAAVLASLLPAWKVGRTPIVDALRQNV